MESISAATTTITGAEAMLRAAVDAGVKVCFANPGTTEIELVNALENVPEMRAVLGLFEGVCTGMADGYARMTCNPALTLLHLGVGLGNGIANLHNARRARSPIVNIIGDHPVEHLPFDPPLASDIETMAAPVSHWVHKTANADDCAADIVNAIARARSCEGQIATLLTPMDVMRHPTTAMGFSSEPTVKTKLPSESRIERAAEALRKGEPAALLLSGRAVHEHALVDAHRIAAATGCRVMCDSFPARLDRGAGIPPVERLPYFPEMVVDRLKDVRYLILVGAPAPVSFFKYEDYPSSLVPEDCEALTLAALDDDAAYALSVLAQALNAPENPARVTELSRPAPASGELTTKTIGQAIGALLPEGAIIADESATCGGSAYHLTMQCPRHSAMYLTGGGIGMGLPLATGAAVACPERPVLALQGDGGGMYTLQALWTQAREGLNVTNVILANRRYAILQTEQQRAGVDRPGPVAQSLFDLDNPTIDWCALAKGMGVPAVRPDSAEAFYTALKNALAEPGPHLIEAII